MQSNNTNITVLRERKGEERERQEEGGRGERERVKEEMVTNYNTMHTNLMIHITY